MNQTIKFSLGQVVATPGSLEALAKNHANGAEYLKRHASGDWGTLCEEDKQGSSAALKTSHN